MDLERAFLDAVCADPEALAVRLVYADWLDERRAPGDAERAEFIRVQIELAKGPPGLTVREITSCLNGIVDASFPEAGTVPQFGDRTAIRCLARMTGSTFCWVVASGTFSTGNSAGSIRLTDAAKPEVWRPGLYEREKALLNGCDYEHWLGYLANGDLAPIGGLIDHRTDPPTHYHGGWCIDRAPDVAPPDGGRGPAIEFRRGFVEFINLPCTTWLKYGPVLVKAHPLREVRLSDRGPYWRVGSSGMPAWCWEENRTGGTYTFLLPSELWSRIPIGQLQSVDGPGPSQKAVLWEFASCDEAQAALSKLCLDYARSR